MRCWYTRWQMSNALDRGELASGMARGHAARCAACQAFGHALTALDTRLSRDAHAAAAPVPVARRARSPWLVAGPLAAGAAAVIAIAIAAGGGQDGAVPAGRHGPAAGAAPAPRPPEAPAPARGLAGRLSQVLASTPLEAELDALLHDGRRGLEAVLATGGLRRPR